MQPLAPLGHTEYLADQSTGLIIEAIVPDPELLIELGAAYEFDVLGRQMTGVVVRVTKNYVTLKTKKATFCVPTDDVLRRVSGLGNTRGR